MGATQREHISAAINYFWGDGIADAHAINEDATAVVYEALEEAQCWGSDMKNLF